MNDSTCGGRDHFSRRTLLRAGIGAGAMSWLTPLSSQLAQAAEEDRRGAPARSVIVLWLAGGPSQLETFDPHPGTQIAGGTKAIDTAVKGVQLAEGFEQLAEQMESVSLVRSIVSKEGDHERATYNVKTGFRPVPALVHPSIGAVVCHQSVVEDRDRVEIPRHVSIMPNQWPGRGGYLGDQFDAFKINDPRAPIPDIQATVGNERFGRRRELLTVVEDAFARGRLRQLDNRKTLHRTSIAAALRMMTSEQLKAFDISDEPRDLQAEFGDTPFGRGCLAAVRLVGQGVRCVEVTLNGFDSHVNNHETHRERLKTLDPAFATLIKELKRRELFDRTIVLCGGEFGRTPKVNGAGGRDHWPHGFSVALAGGGIRGGQVVGETSPDPKLDKEDRLQDVANPVQVADVHATILKTLGIDYTEYLQTPINRPMIVSEGAPLAQLITS